MGIAVVSFARDKRSASLGCGYLESLEKRMPMSYERVGGRVDWVTSICIEKKKKETV